MTTYATVQMNRVHDSFRMEEQYGLFNFKVEMIGWKNSDARRLVYRANARV